MNWFNPGIVIFLGALIVAFGAFWQFHRQTATEQRLAEKSEEIAALNRELAAKSEEIARLTKDNFAAVTGGDSFCYVALAAREDAAGPTVTAVHQGKYPLYDVDLRITDLKRWSTPPGKSAEQLIARFHLGTLAASTTVLVGRMPPLRGETERFNLHFSARNGFWTQLVRLRKVDGTWKMATKVTRGPAPGQVSEQILIPDRVENGFPAGGEVDWR
jgi:hypothetical protein